MYPIKPTIDFEPTDPYQKAKKDVMTALISVKSLPEEQQRRLAEELVGAKYAAMLINLARYGFKW